MSSKGKLFQLSPAQKRMWGVGASVILVGGLIKFGYFYLSREMIIDNLEKRDREARSYLKESREFAKWSAQDREKKLIKLTDEQREDLQNYLALMRESNKNIYPYETSMSLRKQQEKQGE